MIFMKSITEFDYRQVVYQTIIYKGFGIAF